MLKNTWDKGFDAETCVLQLLKSKDYLILHHRLRTPFAELDLVVKGKSGQLVVIEVKTRSGNLNDLPVIGGWQKKRLKRATRWLIEQGNSVELWLAVVSQDQKIQFFQDVFD